jgi:hypothetical protein
MKLQHAIYINHILEMPIWLSFDYGIVHIYTTQEGGANTAHVTQHRPPVMSYLSLACKIYLP